MRRGSFAGSSRLMDLKREKFLEYGGTSWGLSRETLISPLLTSDSRRCRPGALFVAKQGHTAHGEAYVQDAIRRGAAAVISEKALPGVATLVVPSVEYFEESVLPRLYDESLSKMKLIGVTGTKGKTTTAFFFYEAALKEGKAAAYIGTVGVYTKEGFLKRTLLTTPDIYELYALLEQLADLGHSLCVLEVSSHALDQGRIRGLRFQGAGFTNLSWDHLDYHHSMETYFDTKRKLFTSYNEGTSVINCDDPWGRRLRSSLESRQILCFGQKNGDVRFRKKGEGGDTLLTLSDGGAVRLGMPGEFNAYNAILAALLLKAAGSRSKEWSMGFNGVPGRLERLDGHGVDIYIDYAHSPDSLDKVLSLLAGEKRGRLITVFGCTGDRDRGKRPEMAKIASRFSDFVIITSDDPHSEDPFQICREVEAGMKSDFPYEVVVDREEAIRTALKKARNGDMVLIAGKGHERFQIFDGYEIPFNDREVVERLLKKRRTCGED